MNRIFETSNVIRKQLFTTVLVIASIVQSTAQVGELDYGYTIGTGFNGAVNASALQSDGKLIVGGAFTSYNGTTRNYIARLNTNGTLDTSFDPGTTLGAAVLSLAIQPSDGKIIVGGSLAGSVARLNTNGTSDGTFVLTGSGLNSYVERLVLQPADEKIIIVGPFTSYNGTSRNRIARLNTTGTLDTGFDPGTGFNDFARAVAIQGDGKIVVGGEFSSFNGTNRTFLTRINSDGSIDGTFLPGSSAPGKVYAVAVQGDGKILAGGGVTSFAVGSLIRLSSTGAIENSFSQGQLSSVVKTIIVQSDNKIVFGGWFEKGLRRVNANGTNDQFIVSTSGVSGKGGFDGTLFAVNAVSVQSDGKIIASGEFTSFNAVAITNIARLGLCSSVIITTSHDSKTVCNGNNTSFVIDASAGYTYQWQVNSASGVGLYSDVSNAGVYTGATTSTLTLTSVTTGMNGYYYRCLVSDGTCTTTTFSTTLTVHPTPVVNTQPTDKTKCDNETPTFTIAGTNVSSFQWQEDRGTGFTNLANGSASGVGYSGVTTSTLSVLGPSVSYTGYKYRCIAGPPSGSCSPSIISSEATLTITASPVITTQPVTGSICNAGNTTFQVAATGSGLTYQWQEKVPAGSFGNITDGGIYSGALTNQLTLTGATTSQNSNQYKCIITGSNTCSTTSNAGELSVYSPPVISTHPANSTKCIGSSTTFTVAVTSPPPGLAYQWQEKVGTGSFTNLTNTGVYSNVTTVTLTLTGVTAGMNGNKYRCVVGACSSPVISAEADLIVDSPALITLQPEGSIVCVGTTTTFTTNATGLGVTFQWQISPANFNTYTNVSNGGIYAGATTQTLTLTNVQLNDNGYKYRCVVTASGVCVAVNTSTASLTVREIPVISSQPADQAKCEGATTIFSVNAINTFNSYQWQADSGTGFQDLVVNSVYTSVTTSSLNFISALSMNNTKYRCRLGSCATAFYSNAATLTVNTLPAITTQPVDKTICVGEGTTFTVAATGTGLSYSWQGVSGTGGNTSTLTLDNVPVAYNGLKISCRVSGTCTPLVISTEVTLTVNEVRITTQPVNVASCVGDTKTFAVVATGTSLTYQWKEDKGQGFADIVNGGIYEGATTANLALTGITAAMTNFKYQCIVSGACAPVTSSTASLAVTSISKPTITVNATSNPETPQLLSSVGGSSYQWYKDGIQIPGNAISLNATGPGAYTVKVTLNGCTSELSDSQAIIITGDFTPNASSSIHVYPNPGSDHVTLSLGGFEKDKPVSISIVDMQGRVMEKTTGLGQHEVSIDIRNYAGGKYIAWLQQRTTKVSRQFIKSDK